MSASSKVKPLVLSGLFIALGFLLPFLTGQIPEIGRLLSPMHIPALLCGFVCGWPYGLAVGFITPLLRSLTLGMPPLMPTGIAMAFELAAYGAAAGLLYRKLPKTTVWLYVSLIAAMLIGRLVWGLVSIPLYLAAGSAFTWAAFLAGAFARAVPGIICHIAVVPLVVLALRRAKFME